MDNENNILILSIKDLFTKKMIQYSILPFIISALILYTLFFLIAGVGIDQLSTLDIQSTQTTLQNGIPNTDTFVAHLQGSAIIQFLMSHAITSWIASFFIYTIGGFFVLYASIFVAVIVIGFLTPLILKELQKRHYPDIELKGHSNIFEYFLLLMKWIFVMVFLFILFIPLYFIPVLNVIAFNFPLYYFFHKMMTYDIASEICTREEDIKIRFFYASTLRLKTLGLYLTSLIPFVVFFASVFYVIYLGNSYFLEVRKLRDENNNE